MRNQIKECDRVKNLLYLLAKDLFSRGYMKLPDFDELKITHVRMQISKHKLWINSINSILGNKIVSNLDYYTDLIRNNKDEKAKYNEFSSAFWINSNSHPDNNIEKRESIDILYKKYWGKIKILKDTNFTMNRSSIYHNLEIISNILHPRFEEFETIKGSTINSINYFFNREQLVVAFSEILISLREIEVSKKTKEHERKNVTMLMGTIVKILFDEYFLEYYSKETILSRYFRFEENNIYYNLTFFWKYAKHSIEIKDYIIKLIDEYNKCNNRELFRVDTELSVVYNSIFKIHKIDSLNKYLSTIDSFNSRDVVYRGHSKLTYKMIPSVYRNEYHHYEKELINEILRLQPNEFVNLNTHFQQLSKLQHYETPTRLLDFTSNPLVALYFASKENEESIGEVIVTEYEKNQYLNIFSDKLKISTAIAYLDFEEKIKLHFLINVIQSDIVFRNESRRLIHQIKQECPSFENMIQTHHLQYDYFIKGNLEHPRIIAQSGCFAISKLRFDPTEEIRLVKGIDRGVKNLLFVTNKTKIIQELQKININESTMFPELPVISRYVKNNISNL